LQKDNPITTIRVKRETYLLIDALKLYENWKSNSDLIYNLINVYIQHLSKDERNEVNKIIKALNKLN
jgi:hypothetical protein